MPPSGEFVHMLWCARNSDLALNKVANASPNGRYLAQGSNDDLGVESDWSCVDEISQGYFVRYVT